MKKIFKNLFQLISFVQIPKSDKRIVFYSEGKDTWVHMEGIIIELLKITEADIFYISSDVDDPGLKLDNENYKAFIIEPGHVLNWLFSNIKTDLMIMTTPDLNNFQLKVSKYKVHYIYIQHSLVSLHMAYKNGAFDYYQTVFCAGPHHIEEMKAIERMRGLLPKNLFEHGYSKLDGIINKGNNYKKSSDTRRHILIAPSWGSQSIIDTVGDKVIEILLGDGFMVTLRPHPQTIKLSKNKIVKILDKYRTNSLFFYEPDITSQASLNESDLMISDWSGASLDYAFGLNKPILFIDVPKKVNNPEYLKIKINPLEVKVRSEIGEVLPLDRLDNLTDSINNILENFDKEKQISIKNKTVFNIGKADIIGAEKIHEILNNIVKQ